MVSSLARVFLTINNNADSSKNIRIPMINSVSNSLSTYLSSANQVSKKKNLMNWFKNIPELTALARKVAKNIVGSYHFETIAPNESGRNKILKANKFATQVSFERQLFSQVIDILITGEGFGWIGKIKDEQLNEAISKSMNKQFFINGVEKKELSSRVFKELKRVDGFFDTTGISEELLKPRKYRSIASSTMEIIYDQYDILKYRQVVGINQNEFSTDEIIHMTFEEIDGKVNGFTPVESIIIQLELLRQMWQNMLSLHKNGGTLDRIYVLEDTLVNSPEYKRMEEQLMQYKLVENRHGSMLFTGKVKVEDVQQLDKMQFMDSGLYITGLIAMQWGIPRSSIPYIVGGTNTKADIGGGADKDYWENIKYAQCILADVLNTQLWIPYFGVKLVFENPYLQHDVQMESAWNMKLTNIKSVEEILARNGKTLKVDKKLDLLNLTSEDIEDLEFDGEIGYGGMNNQLSNQQVNDSEERQNVNENRRQESNSSNMSRGMKPTGVGKEKVLHYVNDDFWYMTNK